MKTLLKLGALGAVAAGAVVLVKRYDLVNRGVALANAGIDTASEKADAFVGTVVGKVDNLLTKYEESLISTPEEKKPPVDDLLHEDAYLRETTMGYGDVR